MCRPFIFRRKNMPFIDAEQLPKMELFPGALSGIVAGEGLMLSFLEMAEGSEVPEHSHPHEQAGLVLSGELQFRIGSEERILKPGEAFIVPSNVVHSGVVAKGPARVLDIFTPPREDYIDQYNKHTSTSVQTKWE
ncbi:cupin domain-containing protein [Candidatus Poribacteria bacterium]|nr:MAG: cupin domain-containing protein [Candidatus Poribacteria bacterium]